MALVCTASTCAEPVRSNGCSPMRGGRALDAGARHASQRRRSAGHRRQRRDRRDLPDDRSQPRRRLVSLRAYLDAGGALGIGPDSQISLSPVEVLRWLEYGQRLATHHRNIAVRAGFVQRRRNHAARHARDARNAPATPPLAMTGSRWTPSRAVRRAHAGRRGSIVDLSGNRISCVTWKLAASRS